MEDTCFVNTYAITKGPDGRMTEQPVRISCFAIDSIGPADEYRFAAKLYGCTTIWTDQPRTDGNTDAVEGDDTTHDGTSNDLTKTNLVEHRRNGLEAGGSEWRTCCYFTFSTEGHRYQSGGIGRRNRNMPDGNVGGTWGTRFY